ncbi:MAG: UDP-glucose--hexose-1-phosphate uridylyltransferase [Anaerolineae bacterium]
MATFNLNDDPHRRFNPLTREWVLVSPHRTKRPWQGQVEKLPLEERPVYDPNCYLCPGNMRAGGAQNPQYDSTFVFTNDFASLLPDIGEGHMNQQDLLVAHSERGTCRVICFSPRHDLTLAEMEVGDIRRVVDVWVEEYLSLGANDWINYVQIFENKGAMMGCSNPHPHGQIWANQTVPVEPAKEIAGLQAYRMDHRSCLLCDYVALEERLGERIVCANDHFVVVVPFWAIWPFETMLLPRRHVLSLDELDDAERDALADIIRRLTIRYDNLFEVSFPYSMGFHQQPTDGHRHPEWHLHAHYYPPLLRSATVRKFMVGYEMLANPQRDITPEASAARLRELSEVHFRQLRAEA